MRKDDENPPILTGFLLGDVAMSLILVWVAASFALILMFSAPAVFAPAALAAIALGAYWIRSGRASGTWADRVLRLPGRAVPLQLVLLASIGTLLAVTGVAGFLVDERFSAPPGFRQELIDYADLGWSRFAILLIAVGVVLPVIEEVAFRGLIMRSLLRRGSAAFAVAASSLLFGLTHAPGGVGLLVIATLLGVACGWFTWRTGSLLSGIGIHGVWNSTMLFNSRAPVLADPGEIGVMFSGILLVAGLALCYRAGSRTGAAGTTAAPAH